MVAYFTDPEASGAGEFLDTAGVGVRYTIGAGTVTPRVYFPGVAPGGSQSVKIYDTGGSLLHSLTLATSNLSAWNSVTTSPSLAAGTYDLIWSTTRYKAISGFFSGGSVTRSGMTGVTGRFNPTLDAAPNNNSTAGYVVELDWVSSSGTPFTKDQAETYRIFNALTKDTAESYRVFNVFSKDAVEVYRILNSLGLDVTESYRIFAVWSKDQADQYRIFNLAQLDVVDRYRVFAAWVRTLQERYKIGDGSPALPAHVVANLSAVAVIAHLDDIAQ
jgi:hypothetical protein